MQYFIQSYLYDSILKVSELALYDGVWLTIW